MIIGLELRSTVLDEPWNSAKHDPVEARVSRHIR